MNDDEMQKAVESVIKSDDSVPYTDEYNDKIPKPQRGKDYRYIPTEETKRLESERRIQILKNSVESYTNKLTGSINYSMIKELIEKVVIELDPAFFKYATALYPEYAAQVLILSRSEYWPGGDINKILENILAKWLKEEVSDLHGYVSDLMEVIDKEKCMSGVLNRLNFDTIITPDDDSIKINKSKIGPVVIHNTSTSNKSFSNDVRKKMKEFLKSRNHYTNDINKVYNNLKNDHDKFSYEQALLSWMGYLVLKIIARNSSTNATDISNNTLTRIN